MKSKQLAEASRMFWKIDIVDPAFNKHRILIDDPRFSESIKLTFEPKKTLLKKLNPDPNRPKLLIDI